MLPEVLIFVALKHLMIICFVRDAQFLYDALCVGSQQTRAEEFSEIMMEHKNRETLSIIQNRGEYHSHETRSSSAGEKSNI